MKRYHFIEYGNSEGNRVELLKRLIYIILKSVLTPRDGNRSSVAVMKSQYLKTVSGTLIVGLLKSCTGFLFSLTRKLKVMMKDDVIGYFFHYLCTFKKTKIRVLVTLLLRTNGYIYIRVGGSRGGGSGGSS